MACASFRIQPSQCSHQDDPLHQNRRRLTKGELWQVNETLTTAVRGVIGQWLTHVVSLQACLLNSFLHHLHRLHTGVWVKVAVDAHDLRSYKQVAHQPRSRTTIVRASIHPTLHLLFLAP